MTEYLIHFESMEWEHPKKGMKQKIYSDEKDRIRLLRFSDDFIEEEWCLKNHIGFVLNGEMKINFNGEIKSYRKGDGLWIKEGESSKHKVSIEKGKHIELILFESSAEEKKNQNTNK